MATGQPCNAHCTEARSRRRNLRHPGGRKPRSVALSAPFEGYALELADRYALSVSGVFAKLLHEHALRDKPARDLPFELAAH